MSQLVRWLSIAVCLAQASGCQTDNAASTAADARRVDAMRVLDAATDASASDAWALPPRLCTDMHPTARASGITPLGSVSYSHAWPLYLGDKCSSLTIYLTSSTEVDANRLTEWPQTIDTVRFWLNEPQQGGFVGVHAGASFEVLIAGESRSATGRVTIDHFDDPYAGAPELGEVRGSFEVRDEQRGWDLAGSFGSAYCEHLLSACP